MPPSPVQILTYVAVGLAQLTSQFQRRRPDAIIVTTGTGIQHVTAGVLDGAAFIGTANQILVTNGAGTDTVWTSTIALAQQAAPTGTGLVKVVAGAWAAASSLVVDADVNAAAAIAGSKITPTFGAQAVTGASYDINAVGLLTVGGVATSVGINVSASQKLLLGSTGANFISGYTLAMGTSTSGTGYIRFPTGVNQLLSFLTSGSANGNVISIAAGDSINIGDAAGTNGSTRVLGLNIFVSPTTGGTIHFQGNNLGVEWMNIDAAGIHGTLPFSGDASSNKPYQLLSTSIVTAAAVTLTAAQYACPIVYFTGATICTATFPSQANAVWQVVNQSSAALTLKCGTGATTIAVAAGKRQDCSNDGANAMIALGGNF